MISRKKEDELILDCYRELYNNSTPKADFDVLLSECEIVNGEKTIPFNDYHIDDKLLHEIIEKYSSQIKPEWVALRFKNTILLGCSPNSREIL